MMQRPRERNGRGRWDTCGRAFGGVATVESVESSQVTMLAIGLHLDPRRRICEWRVSGSRSPNGDRVGEGARVGRRVWVPCGRRVGVGGQLAPRADR